MATKSEAIKMNVRSPFYVIADDEGKPESIAADFNQAVDTPTDEPATDGTYTNTNLPDQPDAYVAPFPDSNTGATTGPDPYVQPETFQETVFNGDVINIGEDVGIRVFEFDTDDCVSDMTIDFEVTTPVKIRAFWNGSAIDYGNGGYIGDSAYDAALTEAGIAAGDRQLGSGTQTGTITVTKDEATTAKRFITVVVTAPLINDNYKLTFGGCSVPGTLSALPVTPDGTRLAYTFPIFHLQSQPGRTVQTSFTTSEFLQPTRPSLTVNGIKVVDSMAEDTVYTFHDNPEIGQFKYRAGENLTTVNTDRSTYFHPGINYIDIETPGDFSLYGGQHDYTYYWGVSGVFHDGSDWEFPLIADKGKYQWNYYTVATSGNNWQIGATQKVFHQKKPFVNRLLWYINDAGNGYPIRWNTGSLTLGPTTIPDTPSWTHFVGAKSALTDGGGTSKPIGSTYS